ncbi:hypothetical protein ACERJO_19945 [Halalkalibacter sp. AB-rgal2]|uniref:hypothetical protein n=1 Tax=Halalkalibacter sp. AB-rgal2 TaxID=3242695 RepID=UPI00359E0026
MNEYTPDEICAKLTTGACTRDLFPQLKYNLGLKEKVAERLDQAGYEFVDDPISDCYDARIKPHIRSLTDLVEGELGKGLTIQAKAMIAILWCYLILPRIDSTMKEGLKEDPYITEDQLFENFKQHIGSRQNLRRTLTLLRQYDFIQSIWGKRNAIKAGPRLTTAINPVTMYDLVKDKVIDFLIHENEERKEDVEETFSGLEEIVSHEDGGDNYASAN